MGVTDFVREVKEDQTSPTTSTFVHRIPHCRETVSRLDEVSSKKYVMRFLHLVLCLSSVRPCPESETMSHSPRLQKKEHPCIFFSEIIFHQRKNNKTLPKINTTKNLYFVNNCLKSVVRACSA